MKKIIILMLCVLMLSSCASLTSKSTTKKTVDTTTLNSTTENVTTSSQKSLDLSKYIDLNYKPSFDNISEVSFYSLLASKMSTNKQIKSKKMKLRSGLYNVFKEDEPEDVRYPIEGNIFSFSYFTYFTFEATDNAFLEEKIGLGTISGLIVEPNFSEMIIVLKNEDKYFSCVENGSSSINDGVNTAYREFNASRYFENFDFVKASTGSCRIICNYETTTYNPYDLNKIIFSWEGNITEYDISLESVYFEDTTVSYTVNGLRTLFGLDPIDTEEIDELEEYKLITIDKMQTRHFDLPGVVEGKTHNFVNNAETVEEIDAIYEDYLLLGDKFSFYNLWKMYAKSQDISAFEEKIKNTTSIEEIIEVEKEYQNINDSFVFGEYKNNITSIINELLSDNSHLLDGERETINNFIETDGIRNYDIEDNIYAYLDDVKYIINTFSDSIDMVILCQIYRYYIASEEKLDIDKWIDNYKELSLSNELESILEERVFMKNLENDYKEVCEKEIPDDINSVDKDLYYSIIEQYFSDNQ